MNTIWKFQLRVTDEQKITMPKGAEILSLQVQRITPCLWALVESDNEAEDREFLTYGTGHNLSCDGELKYVGSYQLDEGSFLGHVFERIKPKPESSSKVPEESRLKPIPI